MASTSRALRFTEQSRADLRVLTAVELQFQQRASSMPFEFSVAHVSLPSSTSIAISAVVNAFIVVPVADSVCSPTFAASPMRRTP